MTAISTRRPAGTRRRLWLGAGLAAGAVALPLGWYLAAPLFVDQVVDEAQPAGAALDRPEGTSPGAAGRALQAARRGSFTDVDAIHRGQGTATLIRQGDGQYVLRFEEFRVTNGPDLYVYLSDHPQPRSSEQLHEGASLELGRLKGNVGSQNYPLPATTRPDTFRSAVIYCRRFGVIFSTAELRPVA
jgi:hypothetical protein